jgi:hypothetical protein
MCFCSVADAAVRPKLLRRAGIEPAKKALLDRW